MSDDDVTAISRVALLSFDEGKEIELGSETIVGRSATCDLAIDNGRLSRQHAKLTLKGKVLVVEDLGSTNGTFVNNQKITSPTPLSDGDTLAFEEVRYKVVIPGPPKPDKPADGEIIEEELESKTMVAQLPEGWWAVGDEQSDDMTRAISLKDLPADLLDVNTQLDNALKNSGDKPCLVCMTGNQSGTIFRFNATKDSNKWEIGKNPDCDVTIDDPSMSANHAQIINEGARWQLVDLMSTNGSFINGNKTLSSYLANDDNIRLGEIQFKFRTGNTTETKVTPVDGGDEKNNGALITAGAFALTLVVLGAAYYFMK